jgi:hypothetical protein
VVLLARSLHRRPDLKPRQLLVDLRRREHQRGHLRLRTARSPRIAVILLDQLQHIARKLRPGNVNLLARDRALRLGDRDYVARRIQLRLAPDAAAALIAYGLSDNANPQPLALEATALPVEVQAQVGNILAQVNRVANRPATSARAGKERSGFCGMS